ncbi:type V CRISPR-associated protein Cas12k [Nostoc sp.]|uniref:type V CRISPR-associated protein Cas12k n=1 Tax=Nostoc sp. TaxID=1180 RepID=UPI002FF743EF
MSVITIQCRLIAKEDTLCQLWELMAEKNTPLINELLEQVGQHPDFDKWLKQGEVSEEAIETIKKSLITQERFAGQPGRFYTSAVTLVKEVYKSWFALQQQRQRKIEGKERWLKMLKSDTQLQQESQCSLDIIRNKANEILNSFVTKFTQQIKQASKIKKGKKKEKAEDSTLFNALFDLYDKTEDCLSKCAITYLLKNDCQVSEIDEEQVEYAQRRRRKEIEIERLREQLKSRKPKGRDLTGEKWLTTLEEATNQVPLDEFEAKSWQASLLKLTSNIPYPVDYETNTDLDWLIHSPDDEIKIKIILVWQVSFFNHLIESRLYSLIKYLYFQMGCLPRRDVNWLNLKNKPGRILVKFNGLKKNISNPEFYICCDSRQRHYFQRFCQDWQVWDDNNETYSSGLLFLRSARLLWQERKGTGAPWKVNRLILQCSIETRLWTEEETEPVRTEKIGQAEKTIRNMEQKGDLTQQQLSRLQGKRTERQRLNNPFPGRPSKPLYQGKSNIIVGVSFGLDKPAMVAVVDAANKKVLAYRSTKQLLGKNYNLLNRQRQQQQRLSHERHKAQKRNAPNSFGESELGQYVDRLLADAIIAIAKTYQADSIVIPKLRDMREQISSEIQSRAEKKCPGYKEAQHKYAKEYRMSVHRWSYGRLIESIKSQAAKAGISTKIGTQPIKASSQEKARDLAVFAYQERQVA